MERYDWIEYKKNYKLGYWISDVIVLYYIR